MSVLGTIGAGLGIASGVYNLGKQIFGSNSSKNKGYITNNNGFSLGENGITDNDGRKLDGTTKRISEDYYWQQLMNEYNIAQQKQMASTQQDYAKQQMALAQSYNVANWNMENAYNTPAQQAARLKQAGINPILAMQNEGSIGQAGSVGNSNAVTGSQGVSGSIGSSGVAAAHISQQAALDNVSLGAGSLISESIMRQAETRKASSSADQLDIDNLTRNLENLARIRELRSRANTQEEKAQLTRLEKELLDQTFQYKVNQESSRAASMYNDTILQEDQHAINQYSKSEKYYQQAIAKLNYEWLPQEKGAAIASEYAKARMYGASATEAMRAAEKYAAETQGIHLTNDQRKDLDSAFRDASRDQYQAIKVGLQHAKEMLKQAKYDSDHQAIKFWSDQVESYTRSFKNITSGVSDVVKSVKGN